MELLHILSLLEELFLPLLVTHVFAAAIGIGGVTVTDILFLRFLQDLRISKKEEDVMTTMGHLILAATILLIVTGVGLYLPKAETLRTSAPFLLKMSISLVLTVNGLLLHAFITPRLITMGRLRGTGKTVTGQRHWHQLAFGMGAVSMVSWYAVFLIASLKAHLWFSYEALLAMYLAVLCAAVGASQFVAWKFLREVRD